MRELTGEETAADMMRMAIDDFSKSILARQLQSSLQIIYKSGIPYLVHYAKAKNDWGDYFVQYRLDKMLLTLYPECERIVDETNEPKLMGSDANPRRREQAVNYLASYAMQTMLTRLLLHQRTMFEENFAETVLLASSAFLMMLDHARPSVDKNKSKKETNDRVRTMLDLRVKASAKMMREHLVEFLQIMPILAIPTGAGRPLGSTKPPEQKAQESAEFEKQVEETIRQLLLASGEMPTKTAVAKELGIGGLSLKSGVDSSLAAFNNKLARLSVDYKAIVERIELNK
jgi:hypothetical protein